MNSGMRYSIAAVTCGVLIASGLVRWRAAVPRVDRLPETVAALSGSIDPPTDSMLATAEEFIVSNDPFRLSNKPPTIRFNANNDAVGGAIGASALVLRPNLTLKAIVGGPPWQAIVDGLPGVTPGTMLESGAVFDKLTVRAVTRDSVIIQGPDTAWVLSFRKLP